MTAPPRLRQVCARMERFPPSGGLIPTTVTFTKMQYAQLRALRLYAPKPFRLPPTTDPEYISHELGMKLVRVCVVSVRAVMAASAERDGIDGQTRGIQACGFEMLLSAGYLGPSHEAASASAPADPSNRVRARSPQDFVCWGHRRLRCTRRVRTVCHCGAGRPLGAVQGPPRPDGLLWRTASTCACPQPRPQKNSLCGPAPMRGCRTSVRARSSTRRWRSAHGVSCAKHLCLTKSTNGA